MSLREFLPFVAAIPIASVLAKTSDERSVALTLALVVAGGLAMAALSIRLGSR